LDLRDKIEKLLSLPRQDNDTKQVTSEELDYVGEALAQVAHVLQDARESIPGASITEPGKDPRTPEFYVASLRVPKRPAIKFDHSMRLYIVAFPELPDELRLVKAVVIGDAGQMMGPGRFLQSWYEAKVGGVVYYSGTADNTKVRTATEQTILRFLERRMELSATYRARGQASVGIWPIDSSFRPRLCPRCYIPISKGSICVGCRSWIGH